MDNALYTTQRVLIPALAESTSKRAFELLYDHIESLEYDYEMDVHEAGVVINRIDVRKTQAQEMIDWIESAFSDSPVWQVRERADIQKALEAGESIVQFSPDCEMSEVFVGIANDVDREYGGGRR
jgi:chromosome partitioning protein